MVVVVVCGREILFDVVVVSDSRRSIRGSNSGGTGSHESVLLLWNKMEGDRMVNETSWRIESVYSRRKYIG